MSPKGRPLPTADVGYPVAQLGSQLSGREVAGPTGVGRPGGDIRCRNLTAAKLPVADLLCAVQHRFLLTAATNFSEDLIVGQSNKRGLTGTGNVRK
jgi:hypothetical protein